MNAFITKISFYFNAHKFKVLIALVVFNGILLFTAHQSKVQLFGKVEAMQYRWTTYTKLYKGHIETRNHYSPIGGAVTENGSRLWNDGFSGLLDEVRLYDIAITPATIERQAVGNGDSAGDFMHIHHNTFLGEDRYGFVLRGRPFIEAYLHHNWFKYSNPELVSRQSNATGNFRVENNHVGYNWPPNTPKPPPNTSRRRPNTPKTAS